MVEGGRARDEVKTLKILYWDGVVFVSINKTTWIIQGSQNDKTESRPCVTPPVSATGEAEVGREKEEYKRIGNERKSREKCRK